MEKQKLESGEAVKLLSSRLKAGKLEDKKVGTKD